VLTTYISLKISDAKWRGLFSNYISKVGVKEVLHHESN